MTVNTASVTYGLVLHGVRVAGFSLLAVMSALPAMAPASITLASISTYSHQSNRDVRLPAISGDGRYVAFASLATNLVRGDYNAANDVFVRDRLAGTTILVSVSSAGAQGNSGSWIADISADGRYVAFVSAATNLVANDTNGFPDVFVHDRETGETKRVSVSSEGKQANSGSSSVSISGDGKIVVFGSHASNLVKGDTNERSEIFAHNLSSGATARVSVSFNGVQANSGCEDPTVSDDGMHVAFISPANNLVPGDTNGLWDVFVRDLSAMTTRRVSVATGGVQSHGFCGSRPSISADGRYVAFGSYASDLVEGDKNGVPDLFVHDSKALVTERINVSTRGSEANGPSEQVPSISGDGRFIVFSSVASNLVPRDTNANGDIFVRGRLANSTELVSQSILGSGANNGSLEAEISSDGNYITFASWAANLVRGDYNNLCDIFVAYRSDFAYDPRIVTRWQDR